MKCHTTISQSKVVNYHLFTHIKKPSFDLMFNYFACETIITERPSFVCGYCIRSESI